MVGQSISHYRIDSELGRGGMGIVYKAQDTKLNRTVALKLLPSPMLLSEEERSRFYREARSAAALSHPNIATVYEIDEVVPEGSREDDARPFIAMEFIDGPSLSERIEQGPIDLSEAVKYAVQLVSALQTAHEQQIVHRDIKSSNVMLTSKGDVKVLDFGLAKTLQSTKLTMTGSTMGTAAYMSPEQSRGEEVDGRSDLWSVGVVLYEMVSGLLPFAGDYEQAVVFGILNQDPKPLTAIRTGVPMELEWVVGKLLEKDRELRYQSAADVLADLRRLEIALEGGSGITRTRMAPPKGGLFSVERSKWQSKPVHWVAGLVIFCLGAVGFRFLIGAPSEDSNPEGPIYLNLALPDSLRCRNPTWSNDGTRILFSADEGKRSGFIVEYDLSMGKLTELTDADYNMWARYAPDGRHIFFLNSGRTLMRQSAGSDQPSEPITHVNRTSGLAWISPHEIVYAGSHAIFVRNLKSGVEDTLTTQVPTGYFNPVVSADSSILFMGSVWGTLALDLSTRKLIPGLRMGEYLMDVTRNGYVLYEALDKPSSFGVRKFDTETQEYEGRGFVVLESAGAMGLSAGGDLIYQPRISSDDESYLEPIWVYRNGKPEAFVADARSYSTKAQGHDEFRISPDGRYLAVRIMYGGGILRFDRSSRTAIQLVDGDIGSTNPTQFSYDGKWLYFYSRPKSGGGYSIYRVDADGKNEPEPIAIEGRSAFGPSIARDDETLVFVRWDKETGADIWMKNLATGEESPIIVAEGNQSNPWIAPDARYVAFQADDPNDEPSVLVKDLRDGTTRVVAAGMSRPRWDWKGAYLYYESEVFGAVYRVSFDASAGMTFGEPETMYSKSHSDHRHWAIDPADDTILASSPTGGAGWSRWKVVLNWTQTLEN